MSSTETGSPDRLAGLLAEHASLEAELADPAVHTDQSRARRLGRRYAQLSPVVQTARELEATRADLSAARELAVEDASFAAEATTLEQRIEQLTGRLREQLLPKDPDDDKDVIVEIKAGEGGAESALFAGDLLRMYLRYAERRGWSTEVLDAVPAELGGYKDIAIAVKSRTDEGIWSRLKFEGGVHRVQRVPVTESQGRIHTSAAGVLVLPEAEDVDVSVDPNDLRIDVFRSSGPGGQSVNTTDSAVRITHLPTGIVVSSQNEKSQLQNRESALRVLRSRLLAAAREEAAAVASDQRRSQVRTVDRSERVRTYNFPENRISDHRVGYKSHNLDAVLDGDLDAVIDALATAHTAELLAAASLGRTRTALLTMDDVPDDVAARFSALVDQRADRVPLQHLTGRAPFRHLELAVGPGVFVPRPETEQLAGWALERLAGVAEPLVVDLGTGSGALALAIAQEHPGARVTAVEHDPVAIEWTRANAAARAAAGDTPVVVLSGDMTDPGLLRDLDGTVDLVVSNPPYVPDDARLPREVADHDPPLALWGGPDGLDVVRGLLRTAARLLVPGGWLGIEHADQQGTALPALVRAAGGWVDVADHPDLAGRPRYTTARRG